MTGAANDADTLSFASPSQSRSELHSIDSPAATRITLTDDEEDNPIQSRPLNMRRAATDTLVNRAEPLSDDSDVKSPLSPDIRERRHSFNCLRDKAPLLQIMAPRRLKLDVDLQYSYFELRKREHQLERLVEALMVGILRDKQAED